MQYIKFDADKEYSLKNGDTVTVKAHIPYSNKEIFVEKYGAILGETKKYIPLNPYPIILPM